MIIVNIKGGLGNQMSQYAFYLLLSTIHENVKIDITSQFHNSYHDFELCDAFGIDEKCYATQDEMLQFHSKSYQKKRKLLSIPNKILVKLGYPMLLPHYKPSGGGCFVENRNFNITDDYLHKTNAYYDGYWHNLNYYIGIMDIIYDSFVFKTKLDDRNKETLEAIKNTCSVSIHVRRTDYVGSAFDCITNDYYETAINLIERNVSDDITYFIFSDDVEYVKNSGYFEGRKTYFVDGNTGKKSHIDMQLMSNCKHNIIANSTFSWWASLLNSNEDKIVIRPMNYWTEKYKEESGRDDSNLLLYPDTVTVYNVQN